MSLLCRAMGSSRAGSVLRTPGPLGTPGPARSPRRVASLRLPGRARSRGLLLIALVATLSPLRGAGAAAERRLTSQAAKLSGPPARQRTAGTAGSCPVICSGRKLKLSCTDAISCSL